jgi:hypothetical protein
MIGFEEARRRIREVATRSFNHFGWSEVCQTLDLLPDWEIRAHVDDLQREIAPWPSRLRIAPRRWAVQLGATGAEPKVRLCRTLALGKLTTRDEVWRILSAPDLQAIEILRLVYCALDDTAAAELAERLSRTGIRRLEMLYVPVGCGIKHLFQLPHHSALVSVDVSACDPRDGLAAMVADGARIGLREIGLNQASLASTDVDHLVALPGIAALRRLALPGNEIRDDGVRALAQLRWQRLEELDLEATRCGAVGATMIGTVQAFPALQRLSLMLCDIGDEGAVAIAEGTLANVRDLNLMYNGLTARGVSALLSSTRLPALRRLQLAGNPIGNDIVDVLARSPRLGELERLTLDDACLSAEARTALLALPLPAGVLDLRVLARA